jgi:NAD(P)-dependent dehydrogenase (short-subunit alcohol dehydrogenase family)
MKNIFSLQNKTIIVTGASSGIGKQIAITLSELGACIIAVGRNEKRLQETFDLLSGQDHKIVSLDLTDVFKIKTFVSELSSVDGVIFAAGVAEFLPIKFINTEKILQILNINLISVINLTQMLLREKKVNKYGSLVYISSISAKLGVPGTALYAASKSGLNAFVRVAASESAKLKIRANVICPGVVLTPMSEKSFSILSKEEIYGELNNYPLGFGEPIDIAGLTAYLSSDISKWMTGSEIIIDGGNTLV